MRGHKDQDLDWPPTGARFCIRFCDVHPGCGRCNAAGRVLIFVTARVLILARRVQCSKFTGMALLAKNQKWSLTTLPVSVTTLPMSPNKPVEGPPRVPGEVRAGQNRAQTAPKCLYVAMYAGESPVTGKKLDKAN